MAPLIRLTSADPGNPPVDVQPFHVASVVPRKQIRPDLATQNAGAVTVNCFGSKVLLANGVSYNVQESHDVVTQQVSSALSPRLPSPSPGGGIDFKGLDLRDTSQDKKFVESIKEAGVPVSGKSVTVDIPVPSEGEPGGDVAEEEPPTSPAPKKVAAKKTAEKPKLIDRTESTKISVVSDEKIPEEMDEA